MNRLLKKKVQTVWDVTADRMRCGLTFRKSGQDFTAEWRIVMHLLKQVLRLIFLRLPFMRIVPLASYEKLSRANLSSPVSSGAFHAEHVASG